MVEDEIDDSERFKRIFQMSSFTSLMQHEGHLPPTQGIGQTEGPHTQGFNTNAQGAMNASAAPHIRKTLKDPLVWIDLEMTGLDLDKDTIIEIACIVTNGTLDRRFEGPAIAIKHPDVVLDTMCEWCVVHHGKSGLTQRCRQSTVTLSEAENQVLQFIKQHVNPKAALLAGNSVHVDKTFLCRYMPRLDNYLHYRILDVSSITEVAKRWYTREWRNNPKKKNEHTALSDIKESIEELEYYRHAVFKKP